MGDNEIVKALEDAIKIGDAPIGKYWGCTISKLTAKEAVDLINRQKAENSNLTSDLTSLQKDLTSAKAEIEKNENIIRLADKTIETANAEIERLKTNLNIELENYATEYDNKIKSEAYREFAEKSEKELFVKQNEHREHWMGTLNRHRGTEAYKDYEWSIDNWLRGYGEAVQDILAINQNFLNELVGEKSE